MTEPREHILEALFCALQRIPDIALVERGRVFEISDGTPNSIVLYGGDVIGNTDNPAEITNGRIPSMKETLTPYIWGWVEGYSDEIHALQNALYGKIRKAIFSDKDFIEVLGEYQGGIAMDDAVFPPTVKATARLKAPVTVNLFIPYTFDTAIYS